MTGESLPVEKHVGSGPALAGPDSPVLVFLGTSISSLFDFATFYVLLRVFGFGQTLFQTGWFLESIATQTLVLFVIRTSGRPWRNRPSVPLAITTVLVVAIAFILPLSPVASALGFTAPPPSYFAFVIGVVALYLTVVEIAKQIVFRRL